jgi:DNA-binding IclR family transcriptional regulator
MARTRAAGVPDKEVTGPRSLARVLGLFDVLAKSKDGLSLAELNAALKSPKSSLLNLLRPLVLDGYLSYQNGRYRLGASIFRLAASIMAVWNFSSTFRPYLEELATRSQESVYLGVLDQAGDGITYVDAIESPHAIRFSVPIGALRPLYSTAAGRVLLAFCDEEWLADYLKRTKLEARTPRTITTQKALHEELERIRKTHVSVSLGETFPESGAVSSPIFGADGKIVAAIAIGAPVSRIQSRVAEMRSAIVEVAARASGNSRRDIREGRLSAEPVAARPVTASRKRATV